MEIGSYLEGMLWFYMIVFFGSVAAGGVYCLWKRTWRHTWIFFCLICFSFLGIFRDICIFEAYDDPASPNYVLYEGWGLGRFFLGDGKYLAAWLVIGALCYLSYEKDFAGIRKVVEGVAKVAVISLLGVLVLGFF